MHNIQNRIFNFERKINNKCSKNIYTSIDLLGIINYAINDCQQLLLHNKKLLINFEHNDFDEAIIKGSSIRIRQAIFNLVFNSIKHTDQGVINLTLNLINQNKIDYWQLRISDPGIPIFNDEVSSIFEPAFRNYNNKRSIGIYEYDLSVCKEIIEEHLGRIKVINNQSNYDKGVTFCLDIPALT